MEHTKNNWHKWPQEKPTKTGEYLCRGFGGLDNKIHYYVCLWVGNDACNDNDIAGKFYYGGNEFSEIPSGEFEFIKCNEL